MSAVAADQPSTEIRVEDDPVWAAGTIDLASTVDVVAPLPDLSPWLETSPPPSLVALAEAAALEVILVVRPQDVVLEEAWRRGGWADGHAPATWVRRESESLDWDALRLQLEQLGLGRCCRWVIGADSEAGEDARAWVGDLLGVGIDRVDPSGAVPALPSLAEAGLLHAAEQAHDREAAWRLRRRLAGRVPDDEERRARARSLLRAWCAERFSESNRELLRSLGREPATLFGPLGDRRSATGLDGLDELWAPPPTPAEGGLVGALAEMLDEQARVLAEQDAAAQRDVAAAHAAAAKVRNELDRLRGRRAVRAALRVASLAAPVFTYVRSGGASRGPTEPARVVPERPAVVDPPDVDQRSTIVVCIHNALDDVRRCIESIRAHTDLGAHDLVLVDDGSDEATAAFVRDVAGGDPRIRTIRHDTARGYTVAAAAGIASGTTPFAVLLNSDTIVTAGWLEGMLDCVGDDPRVAVVGPWSNAASWQSVPELTDPSGGWHLNPLPAGQSPDDVATAVRDGERLWPEIELVNGFCYLIRRSAYEAVGGLDTETFPRGYGEEDDLSLRLSAAGYRLRVADDVYVHHAKSRSFTPEGRAAIVQTSKQLLRQRHGDRVGEALDGLKRNEPLVRAHTVTGLRIMSARGEQDAAPAALRELAPSIAWVQPHLEQVGGIRRAITMTNLLRSWGARPALVTPDGRATTWLPISAEVLSVTDAARRDFDIVIVSDPDMVESAERLSARLRVVYHLAAYARYRPHDGRLSRFYATEALHLANSRWTAQSVERHTGRPIAGIVPGAVDRRTFRPVRSQVRHDVACYGSSRAHKGTATIMQAARGLDLMKLVDLHAGQQDLASAICSARVFASGAWHEGFNMPPLEAMACGVPVVMTDDGGSRDYARDGSNALIVDVQDHRAMRKAIHRLLSDEALRVSLVREGLRTAFAHSWQRATMGLAEVLTEGLRTRETPPGGDRT